MECTAVIIGALDRVGNEDVTVGGLYHCGVHASFDRWGQGNHLVLVGGEPASGYVNPGENRRCTVHRV